MNRSLQAIGQQGQHQGQQVSQAAKAVSPDPLRLADLLGAEDHLGHKGDGDRQHHPGLEKKRGRGAQQLVVIYHGIERGEHNQDGEQGQPAHGTGNDRLQCDRPADDGPTLRQPEKHHLAHVDRKGVERNSQGKEKETKLYETAPTVAQGRGAAERPVDNPCRAQQQRQVKGIAHGKGGRRGGDQP